MVTRTLLSKSSRYRSILLLFGVPVCLFVVNFILKWIGIEINPIAMDEPFTLFNSQKSLPEIFDMLANENNPPFHFVFMHYWIKWFGLDPLTVRLPGMIVSCLTPVIVYFIGKRFFDLRVGIFAALILTFSNFNLLFAHETRVYPFFVFFTCASFYFFLASLEKPGIRNLILLTLANAFLVYCHFFGAFVWFSQAVAILMYRDYRKQWIRFLLSYFGALCLYIPAIYQLYLRVTETGSAGGTWISETPDFTSLYNLFWKFSNAPVNTILFLATIVAALILRRKRENPNLRIVLAWLFIPLILIFTLSYAIPLFLDRYLVFLSVSFYVLLAWSVTRLPVSPTLKTIAGSIVVGLMVVTFRTVVPNERNLPEIAERSQTFLETPNARVLIAPKWIDIRLAYHLDRDLFGDYRHFDTRMKTLGYIGINAATDIYTLPDSIPLLLIDGDISLIDPNGEILPGLISKFGEPRIWETKGYRLYYFY